MGIGPIHGTQDVRAIAGTADGHEEIAFRSQVLELFHEDAIKAFVVTPGQNIRRVVREAQDLQSLFCVVIEKLACQRAFAHVLAKVGGVRAAATVADHKDKSPSFVAFVDHFRELLDLCRVDVIQFFGDAIQKLPGVECGTNHVGLWAGARGCGSGIPVLTRVNPRVITGDIRSE